MGRDVGDRFSEAFKVKLKNGALTVKNSLGKTDQLDFYRLRVSRRSSLNCLLSGLEDDANLALYNRDFDVIKTSSNYGDDNDSIRHVVNPGVYFIRVNRIEGDIQYDLKFSLNADAGNNFKSARKVSIKKGKLKGNFSFADFVDADDDKTDIYQIRLTSKSVFTSSIQGLQNDAKLTLCDSRGKTIFKGKGKDDFQSFTQVLTAGIYYIKIDINQGSTRYKLKSSFNSVAIDLGGNDANNANPVVIGKSFQDVIGSFDAEDYYKVDLATPSNLKVLLNGLSANANLELRTNNGTTILGSSTKPATAEELLDLNLKAGSYFVRVFPGATNTFTFYDLKFDASPLELYGLTDSNKLLAFNPDQLNKAVSLDINGLATGETLKAIDFRPLTGELFGISSANKVYEVDVTTGATAAVADLSAFSLGTASGFDFNPAVDRLRIVGESGVNLRVNPTTGEVAVDTALPTGRVVTASAYSNNLAGTPLTTLFGIDTASDRLVRQGNPSPNDGVVTEIGTGLGINFTSNTGFDIVTDLGLGNIAYATAGSTLYTINLATGGATGVGTVSSNTTAANLIGFAARP